MPTFFGWWLDTDQPLSQNNEGLVYWRKYVEDCNKEPQVFDTIVKKYNMLLIVNDNVFRNM